MRKFSFVGTTITTVARWCYFQLTNVLLVALGQHDMVITTDGLCNPLFIYRMTDY